jgi:hypothetical protein
MATKKKTAAAETVKNTKAAAAKKVEAVKEEAVQAVVEKAEEVKEDVKEATEKVAEKAAAKTKAVATKTKEAAAKTAGTAKRKVTRKPEKSIVLQYGGKEVSTEELTERAIAQFSALEGGVAVKKVTLYLKPEESTAYYVINDDHKGSVQY